MNDLYAGVDSNAMAIAIKNIKKYKHRNEYKELGNFCNNAIANLKLERINLDTHAIIEYLKGKYFPNNKDFDLIEGSSLWKKWICNYIRHWLIPNYDLTIIKMQKFNKLSFSKNICYWQYKHAVMSLIFRVYPEYIYVWNDICHTEAVGYIDL